MIKNWTVTTQPVKNGADGLISREVYIKSKSHQNHIKTESIINIHGSIETTKEIILKSEEFKLNQKLKRKGGRPLSSYAMEFCLTLPKGMRPSKEQWKNIVRDVAKSLVKKLNISENELNQFSRQIRAVLHQQSQDNRKGSGDHVHLIIGKVLNNRVLNDLQRKSATATIKSAYNTAVLQHYGVDHKNYISKENGTGKKLELWRDAIIKNNESINNYKALMKIHDQAEKWLRAFSINDRVQMNRTFNRIDKNMDLLSKSQPSDDIIEKVSKTKKIIEKKYNRKFKTKL